MTKEQKNKEKKGKKAMSKTLKTTTGVPLTLANINNVGELLKDKGQLAASEELYRKGLTGREEVFGMDHPATLEAAHSLAVVLEARRFFDQTEEMYLRAFEGKDRTLGKKNPSTCMTSVTIADFYKKLNRPKAAAVMYEYAANGMALTLSEEHETVLQLRLMCEEMKNEAKKESYVCVIS